MGGLRGQLSWMVRGRTQTVSSLDSLTRDLQALQEKVAGLEAAISQLHRGQDDLRARQLDEFDRVREAVAAATDDLAARVSATQAQLRAVSDDRTSAGSAGGSGGGS